MSKVTIINFWLIISLYLCFLAIPICLISLNITLICMILEVYYHGSCKYCTSLKFSLNFALKSFENCLILLFYDYCIIQRCFLNILIECSYIYTDFKHYLCHLKVSYFQKKIFLCTIKALMLSIRSDIGIAL